LRTTSEVPPEGGWRDDLAIECVAVTKSYTLGEERSLQRSLSHLAPWRDSIELETFDALRDVSFEVPKGAFYGIVGPNGSGKSTLTQLISGISIPTSGEARVWGRILPLLEVGAGFHEELTGRENIFLLGSILGLHPRQIDTALPDIIEFAGVHRHLDSPLKRYSSGMKARLSFATAICFPAEIYVFDEVLAVVDDDFRAQCSAELARMNDAGRTIIFMSHDLDLVVDMCRTGMLLQRGEVQHVGTIAEVAAAYSSMTGYATATVDAA